jgi:hypothetical protein
MNKPVDKLGINPPPCGQPGVIDSMLRICTGYSDFINRPFHYHLPLTEGGTKHKTDHTMAKCSRISNPGFPYLKEKRTG